MNELREDAAFERRRAIALSLVAAGLLGHVRTADAEPPTAPAASPPALAGLRIGGYVQPAYQARQDDDVAQLDEDGFVLRRARLLGGADRTIDCLELAFRIEADLTPTFELLDAHGRATGRLVAGGRVFVDVGQFKVPVSRQTLLSDAELVFPEKAALAGLAPDRQLGAAVGVVIPGAPFVTLRGGMFDGEGRNQVDNIDQHFLWAGRLEVTPIGRDVPFGESPTATPVVSLGASAARVVRTTGDTRETKRWWGVDLFASAHGAALSAEYLDVRTTYPASAPLPDSTGNGLDVQLAYRLPLPPPLGDRVEIATRFEEIDPNDTIPIERAGDPNQSRRNYVGAASYYLDGHDLKLQASFTHTVEIEDLDVHGLGARYPNDTLLTQLTYRVR